MGINSESAAVKRANTSISPEDLKARLSSREPLQLIDVREFAEFASGHIHDARLLPLGDLEARVKDLDRAIPFVCVCRSGKRSAQATAKMLALGFKDVTQLEGGLIAWEQSGLPLTRAQHAPWSLERQVRFALGWFVLLGLVLSLRWPGAIAISWIIGVGMVFTSIIDWCGMALLLAKAPWNKQRGSSCAK